MFDPARRCFVMSSTDSSGSAFQIRRLCTCGERRNGRMRTGATATSMNSPVCSRLSALWWHLSPKLNPEVWNVKQKTIFQQQFILVPGLACSSGNLWRCTTFQPALAAKHLGKTIWTFLYKYLTKYCPEKSFNKKVDSAVRMEKANAEVTKISFANIKLSLNLVKVWMSALQGDFTINRFQTISYESLQVLMISLTHNFCKGPSVVIDN